MKKLRLLFFRPAQTNYLPYRAMSFQAGVPVSAGTTLRDCSEAYGLIGNPGNMIHRMAMLQILDFDRANSSQVHLQHLLGKEPNIERIAHLIDKRYDAVIITMSNLLRKGVNEPKMGNLTSLLTCKIFCFGLGLQDAFPPCDPSFLHPELLEYLRILNDKSVIFGVRGQQTETWLHSIGLTKAKALGCPSLFAYPQNILSIKAPNEIRSLISAGHLNASKSKTSRSQKLMRAFEGSRVAYVFQGEQKNFLEILDEENAYNEATQALNASLINEYLYGKIGYRPPFFAYYAFNEVGAWRQACLHYDAYIGDRIHGGVAAMQAGIPALILFDDVRVAELVSYHSLPSCSLDRFSELGWRASAETFLNSSSIEQMKEGYKETRKRFVTTVLESGLPLKKSVSDVSN